MLCSISAGAAGATKSDGTAYEADDFLPGERPEREADDDELPEPQSPEEYRAIMQAIRGR